VNGTSGFLQTPVNSSNNVAITTAVSVGIVLGICMTFIIIVSIIILRRRRYLRHFLT